MIKKNLYSKIVQAAIPKILVNFTKNVIALTEERTCPVKEIFSSVGLSRARPEPVNISPTQPYSSAFPSFVLESG